MNIICAQDGFVYLHFAPEILCWADGRHCNLGTERDERGLKSLGLEGMDIIYKTTRKAASLLESSRGGGQG